jgi:hypothetical protein
VIRRQHQDQRTPIDLGDEQGGHGSGGGGVAADGLEHGLLRRYVAAAQGAGNLVGVLGVADHDRLGKSGAAHPLDRVHQHHLGRRQIAELLWMTGA